MFNKTKSTEFEIPEIKVNKKVTNKSAFRHESEEKSTEDKPVELSNPYPSNKVKMTKNLNVKYNQDISNLTSDEVDYLRMLNDMMEKTSKSKIFKQIQSMDSKKLRISKDRLLKLLDSL